MGQQNYIDVPLTKKQRAQFEDVPLQQAKPRAQTTGEQIGGKTGAVVDAGIGALKGLGNTIYGAGKIVRDYTPVGRISDAILPGAFDQKPPELEPQNAAQQVGFTGEQIGEFLLPMATAGKAANVARSVAQTMVQSGSPVEAGLSGAITAAMPGAATAQRASSALQESAEKSVAQALGATKEWAKSEATKIAPKMIERGIKGTRAQMLDRAAQEASHAGQALNAAYKQAAAMGEAVDGQLVRGAIQLSADALKVPNAKGVLTVIPGTERVIRRLERLDQFVDALGPQIPVDKAAKIKRTWDALVSKAGLFGPKSQANATDQAEAWATREASSAFRDLLNTNPTLAALNQESAFWTGLKNVLKETEKRTQSQSGGLSQAVLATSGALAGASSGDSMTERATNALVGGFAAKKLTEVLQSPWFKTTASAPFKAKLADALASQKTGRVLSVLQQAGASVPAQVQ